MVPPLWFPAEFGTVTTLRTFCGNATSGLAESRRHSTTESDSNGEYRLLLFVGVPNVKTVSYTHLGR